MTRLSSFITIGGSCVFGLEISASSRPALHVPPWISCDRLRRFRSRPSVSRTRSATMSKYATVSARHSTTTGSLISNIGATSNFGCPGSSEFCRYFSSPRSKSGCLSVMKPVSINRPPFRYSGKTVSCSLPSIVAPSSFSIGSTREYAIHCDRRWKGIQHCSSVLDCTVSQSQTSPRPGVPPLPDAAAHNSPISCTIGHKVSRWMSGPFFVLMVVGWERR